MVSVSSKKLPRKTLGVALSLLSLSISAANYTTTVSPSVTALADGDTIETANQQGIQDTVAGSPGVQLAGTGKITVESTFNSNDTTSSLFSAVELSNGVANDLGNGSVIDAKYTDAINPSGKALFGIYSGTNTDLTATNLSVTVDANALSAGGTAVGIQSGSKLDLGNSSTITVVGKGNAYGIRTHGSSFDASDLTVDVTGSGAMGLSISSGATANLGQNSLITTNGSYTTYGIQMSQDSSLTADGLTIIAKGDTGTVSGSGLYLSGSNIFADLKNNSSIYTYTKESEGLYVFGGNSTFQATSNLTIVTAGTDSQGAIAQGTNSVADLGQNATITTYGDSTYNATNMRNYSSSAVMARNGGKVIIGDGSQIKTFGNGFSNGILIIDSQSQSIVGDNVSIVTEGDGAYGILAMSGNPSLTAGGGLSVTTKGRESTGVLSQNNATVDLGQNALVQTYGDNAWAVELYNNGTVKADGSTFIAQSAVSDVIHAGGSAKAILTGAGGTTTINAAGGGNALNFTGASEMQGSGKMIVIGDIKSADTGKIDLNMAAGSYLSGSWVTANTATSNLALGSGGRWEITGNSNITNLSLNNSAAGFAQGGFSTLQTQNLSGSGTFFLRVNVKDGLGDLLDVTGNSSGNYRLSITNVGTRPLDADYEHLVVQTADGGAEFSLAHLVDVDGWQYDLHRGSGALSSTNWYLYRTAYMTSLANAVINESRAGYLLNYSENQTLTQRMGELRRQTAENNVWVKGVFTKYNVHSSGQVNSFTQKINGVQIGGDREWRGENAAVFIGLSAGFNNSDQDYDRGTGQIDALSLGLYGSYLHNSGFHTDITLRGNRQKEKFDVRDSAGLSVKNDVKTHGIWGSIEIGQRFTFSDGDWYAEPQLQASFGAQNNGSSIASNGTPIEYQSYNSLLGRGGLTLGYEYKTADTMITPYITASYLKEFDGKTEVKVGRNSFKPELGDSWWRYGAGVNARVKNSHNLYLQVERATGGNFTQPYNVNLGYRLSW